jgi:uncharacterized protein
VIVLDVNILIYAYNKNSPHYAKARPWVEQLFSSFEAVGLPWQTISAFLRLTTHPNLKEMRSTIEQSSKIVDRWLEQPNVRVLAPGESHWALFRRMLLEGQASGGLVTDAHLAALTIEYGGVLHTTDRDFTRFPGLRWVNPLA